MYNRVYTLQTVLLFLYFTPQYIAHCLVVTRPQAGFPDTTYRLSPESCAILFARYMAQLILHFKYSNSPGYSNMATNICCPLRISYDEFLAHSNFDLLLLFLPGFDTLYNIHVLWITKRLVDWNSSFFAECQWPGALVILPPLLYVMILYTFLS